MKKTWNTFSAIVWLVLLAAEGVLGATIIRLNMLPDLYLYLVLGALAFMAVLTGLLVFKRKPGKHEKGYSHGRQIFGYILAALTIAACVAGNYVLSQINQTISAVTEVPVVTDVVNVFVRHDDPAQSIDEANNYRFAVTDAVDWENTQVTVRTLESQFGHPLDMTNYGSVPEMVDALRSGEVDAMILNSSYADILESLDGYADFWDVTRILVEHTIESTVPPTTAPA